MELSKIKAGIIGVAGYGGGELARLLATHPQVSLTYATSNSYAGQKLSACFPGTAGKIDLVCEVYEEAKAISSCDVLFLAGEAGSAIGLAPVLLNAGKKIIDLSADFRLKDPSAYQTWYKKEPAAPELLAQAVYGLPELNRDKIRAARLIANPGCYPTTALLALIPLLKEDWIKTGSIIIDSFSAMSGAGRSKFNLSTHFAERNESLEPYGAGGTHRHIPEMEQILSDVAGEPITITFTPHLAPISRGILTTVYVDLRENHLAKTAEGLTALYQKHYAAEPFVAVVEAGSYPATKHALGSNLCFVGGQIDARTGRAVLFATEDNLVKGMAGQAVQNMNLMFGLEETTGLNTTGLWP